MAKSAADEYRLVTVSLDGLTVLCDCGGFDGVICSHIDAVLIAGERVMVPPEDHGTADAAFALVSQRIEPPPSWRGSWRQNLRWRGLSVRGPRPRRVRSGRPVVCFTGAMDRPRKELLAEAVAAGWDTADSPTSAITVLVAAAVHGKSGKLVYARKNGIPIVALEEWPSVMLDGELPLSVEA
jgi:hypothetical protein